MSTTTIKPMETPEVEVVSVAEDASVECVEQILNDVDNEAPVSESDVAIEEPVEVEVEYQIAGKSKAELVDMLAFLLEQDIVPDVRQYVDDIKTAFYKIHRAQVDGRVKENTEGEEVVVEADADELRLKELLRVYRERRDRAVAESEKVKEENYRLKVEIIEELLSLLRRLSM